MLIAYTRCVSPTLADCELTHLERDPPDVGRAALEHEAYEAVLTQLGVIVRRLPPEPSLPDAVFVEDTAVVLEEVAIITRPGAVSRRPETVTTAAALASHRPLVQIEAPGTLDGGDVLVAGRRVYVGLSTRTNREAIAQMARALEPSGYDVITVRFGGCLHLKSAATRVADGVILLNPEWVDPAVFAGDRALAVDRSEPHAANALAIGDTVIHSRQFDRTRARLEAEGLRVAPVEMVEMAKAEAGVTCCSLLLNVRGN